MEALKVWFAEFFVKVFGLLKSRKFWVLVLAVIGVAQGVALGVIDYFEAAKLLVAAGAAYMGATGIEDGLNGLRG